MRFEHLIQINALDGSGPELLTREQLWRGLALRAYDPTHFIMGLEACSMRNHSREESREILERTLHFGSFEVHDTVTLEHRVQTRVDVAASDNWARSTAIYRIEEPEPLALFLRFTYEWDDDHPAEQALDDASRHAREHAYKAADMDTVQKIREIARQEQP